MKHSLYLTRASEIVLKKESLNSILTNSIEVSMHQSVPNCTHQNVAGNQDIFILSQKHKQNLTNISKNKII